MFPRAAKKFYESACFRANAGVDQEDQEYNKGMMAAVERVFFEGKISDKQHEEYLTKEKSTNNLEHLFGYGYSNGLRISSSIAEAQRFNATELIQTFRVPAEVKAWILKKADYSGKTSAHIIREILKEKYLSETGGQADEDGFIEESEE
jgi:hypothetical protein